MIAHYLITRRVTIARPQAPTGLAILGITTDLNEAVSLIYTDAMLLQITAPTQMKDKREPVTEFPPPLRRQLTIATTHQSWESSTPAVAWSVYAIDNAVPIALYLHRDQAVVVSAPPVVDPTD